MLFGTVSELLFDSYFWGQDSCYRYNRKLWQQVWEIFLVKALKSLIQRCGCLIRNNYTFKNWRVILISLVRKWTFLNFSSIKKRQDICYSCQYKAAVVKIDEKASHHKIHKFHKISLALDYWDLSIILIQRTCKSIFQTLWPHT